MIEFDPMSPEAIESAAICAGGHVLQWCLAGLRPAKFCPECGEATLIACRECGFRIPGSPDMQDWNPPAPSHCLMCGHAYPWRKSQIDMARRTLAVQAEVEEWDEATKERVEEMMGEVASGKATPEYVKAMMLWIAQRAGVGAREVVYHTIGALGSDALRRAIGLPG